MIQPKAVYRLVILTHERILQSHLRNLLYQPGDAGDLEQTERVFSLHCYRRERTEEASRDISDLLHQYALDILKETVLRQALAYLQTYLKETYHLPNIAMMNPVPSQSGRSQNSRGFFPCWRCQTAYRRRTDRKLFNVSDKIHFRADFPN